MARDPRYCMGSEKNPTREIPEAPGGGPGRQKKEGDTR